MLLAMTTEEIKARNERIHFLNTSPYILDNITAQLMSTVIGHSGLYENAAREQASAIISYLNYAAHVRVPERRP
jgi:hypothetical protein